jgi:hypothetical protein
MPLSVRGTWRVLIPASRRNKAACQLLSEEVIAAMHTLFVTIRSLCIYEFIIAAHGTAKPFGAFAARVACAIKCMVHRDSHPLDHGEIHVVLAHRLHCPVTPTDE